MSDADIIANLQEPEHPKSRFGSVASWFKGKQPSYGKKTPIEISHEDEEMIKLNKVPNKYSAVKHSPASRRDSKPGSTPKPTTSKSGSSKSGSKTRKSLSVQDWVDLFFNDKPVNDRDDKSLVNHMLIRPEKKADFVRKAVMQFIPSWLKRGASTTPDILRDKNCYHRIYTDFFNAAEVSAIIEDARKHAVREIPRPAPSKGAAEMKAYIKKVTALAAANSFKAAYGEMCDDSKMSVIECDKDECLLSEATNIARMAAFKVAQELYASVRRHSR